MSNTETYPGRLLALIGGLWGVIGAVILATIRMVLGANNGAPLPGSLPADIVFGLVYLLPFGLALAALRGATPTQRAMAWLAAGALAIVLSFSAFSGVSLIFLPAAPLLLIAGVRALPGGDVRRIALVGGLAIVLIALEIGAFRVLFLQEDGACWQQVRSADGTVTWQSVPYSSSGSAPAMGAGEGQASLGTMCTSDTISLVEMGAALVLMALAAGAWIGAGRGKPFLRQQVAVMS